jgi:hypothetical protein
MPVAQPPVVARASVTISWNTKQPARTEVRQAQVVTVRGTTVLLRLSDGSVHKYAATPDEARQLQSRIGSIISFRMP